MRFKKFEYYTSNALHLLVLDNFGRVLSDVFMREFDEFTAFERLLGERAHIRGIAASENSAPRFVASDVTVRRNCRLLHGESSDGIDKSRKHRKFLELSIVVFVLAIGVRSLRSAST